MTKKIKGKMEKQEKGENNYFFHPSGIHLYACSGL